MVKFGTEKAVGKLEKRALAGKAQPTEQKKQKTVFLDSKIFGASNVFTLCGCVQKLNTMRPQS